MNQIVIFFFLNEKERGKEIEKKKKKPKFKDFCC